jgi:putative oxidoreductase
MITKCVVGDRSRSFSPGDPIRSRCGVPPTLSHMGDQISLALLLLRVVAGLMIGTHGVAHIWKAGKSNIAGTAAWFGSMGMKPPVVQAWLASITELGSGALLILGLLTPLAAAGLLGVMAVAFLIAHRKNGFFIYNPGQGWEYVVVIGAIAVALGGLGAGRWSLDNALDFPLHGWAGFLVTVVGGLGGAALLLATCWRPAPANTATNTATSNAPNVSPKSS